MINYCETCANFIKNDPCDVCEGTENNNIYYEPDFVKKCWLDWLKQEVDNAES